MPNSTQIVYLSQAQYAELIANGSITVNGVTVTYNENDIYVTPQAEPITDVKLAGTSIGNNGTANIPYATDTTPGLVKVKATNALGMKENGELYVGLANSTHIRNGYEATTSVLTPAHIKQSVFYGLAYLSGDTTQGPSNNSLGVYTDEAKGSIQRMLGITDLLSTEETTTATAAHALNSTFMMNGKLHRATAAIAIGDAVEVGTNCEVTNVSEAFPHDVQVNGQSVVTGGVANVPLATASSPGVLKVALNDTNSLSGVYRTDSGILKTAFANDARVKGGAAENNIICPFNQHKSVFYGLSKVAGVDLANETVTLGTYPETSKTAIRTMLGAASPDVVAISDTQPTNTDTKVWLPETQAAGIEVPTYAEFQQGLAGKVSDVQTNGTSIVSNGIANIPVASANTLGVIKADADYGTEIANQRIKIVKAADDQVKQGTHASRPITPGSQHLAAFYGLAKAAGDTTQAASDNAVGTYTADASAAIRSMIGAVGDVQVNGTSVVSNGVANVPVAQANVLGVVKAPGTYGVSVFGGGSAGTLALNPASADQIKAGNSTYNPISPVNVGPTAFYGLAKAAGDTTQSASSNAVGTYTDSAKASIKSMLGIVDGSTGTVDITGTTPSITAVENTRYVCGEVSTLSFTPAASGICIVRFTSGSTATVLTVPNTVKFPEWFDLTALEADTIYEMCITDGIYGAVMSWAL